MQPVAVTAWESQTHVSGLLRAVTLHHLLVDLNNTGIHEGIDDCCHVAEFCLGLQFGKAHPLLLLKKLYYDSLALGDLKRVLLIGFVVGIQREISLAFRLQPGGHGSLVDFAGGTKDSSPLSNARV